MRVEDAEDNHSDHPTGESESTRKKDETAQPTDSNVGSVASTTLCFVLPNKTHPRRKPKRCTEQVKKVAEADRTSSMSDNEYLQQTAEHVTHKVKKIRSMASQDTVLIISG